MDENMDKEEALEVLQMLDDMAEVFASRRDRTSATSLGLSLRLVTPILRERISQEGFEHRQWAIKLGVDLAIASARERS